MNTAHQSRQLWHLGHGIVFAGDDRVVYPRLPLARFHSSPAVVSQTASAGDGLSEGAYAPIDHSQSDGAVTPLQENSDQPRELGDGGATRDDEPSDALKASAAEQKDAEAKEPVSLVPPFTPLEFKIPDKLFRDAKLAEPGSPESFWSYSLYRAPDDGATPGSKVKVHYCKSLHTTERVLKEYFMNEKVLGFDLEWQPDALKYHGPRRNVCLVQLASRSRVALFHLSLYPKNDSLVPPTLKKIMEDPEVTKAGVAIKGDCTRLRTFLQIDSRGIFELSHLYKLVKFSLTGEFQSVNKKLVSLARQVEEYLHLPMFKGQDVRSSDWSQSLQMDQIIYSASDAYAAVQLYAILDHHRQKLDPVPPLPYHAELNKPIRLMDGATTISTADETLEAEPEEANSTDGAQGRVLSEKYLNSLGDSINIEGETDNEPILPEPKPPKAAPPARRPKAPCVVEAETWLGQFRVSHPKTRAAPASLRAYYIWYKNEDLKPDDIAAVLRDPPLQTSTVVNYILEAIRHERLSFQKARLRTEILDFLPKEVVTTRYKTLAKLCEELEDNRPQGSSEGEIGT